MKLLYYSHFHTTKSLPIPPQYSPTLLGDTPNACRQAGLIEMGEGGVMVGQSGVIS